MRTAHFDCFSGISGDMCAAALIDAGAPAEAITAAIDSLGLPIRIEIERVKRCGFAATKFTVQAEDQEDYRFLPDVEAILARGDLTAPQRERATAIFRKVAVAESSAHGMPLERVHFHEVGALDSIADIVAAAVGLDLLGVDEFTSSPVPTGTGTVKCAHGIMPVPTPGTAALLIGVPLAKSDVKFELTTPTGAAILTSTVSRFSETPEMTAERVGTGAGTKDFLDRPNILRLFVGTRPDAGSEDRVWVLETNLDDCPGEILGYTLDALLAGGALDAFAVPVIMKKNRPGVLLTVLCEEATRANCERILFRETGTFGVRRTRAERSKLDREMIAVETPWGPVRAKRGTGLTTPEYADCARVAAEHGIALRDVYAAVTAAVRAAPVP
jgi:pyridinium-3,5-bisthiocarboxylic acid mononucleotide nickel chelatase